MTTDLSRIMPPCTQSRSIPVDAPDYLDPSQVAALQTITSHPRAILTGGPGMGKTTILRYAVLSFAQSGMSVCLCAPTGKAAKVLGDAVGAEGLTIHRAVTSRSLQSCKVVIVDEASMLDFELTSLLSKNMNPLARLILVGDPDQLPPIGDGNVLKILLDNKHIPVAKLTKVFRQNPDSGVAIAAKEILAGRMPRFGKAFRVIYSDNSEHALEQIVSNVYHQHHRKGLSLNQTQVLTPTKRGPLGTANLNRALQLALTPRMLGDQQVVVGNAKFYAGTKIMNTKNNYQCCSAWNIDPPEAVIGVEN